MKIGINKKVNLVSICGILLMGLFLGIYFIRHETQALKAALDERVNVLLNGLSTNIEYALLIRDQRNISRLVQGALSQEDVIYCRVEDERGIPIHEDGQLDSSPIREYSRSVVIKKVVIEGEELILGTTSDREERIGTIYMVISLSGLNSKIQDLKVTVAMVAILTVLLVSLTISLLLNLILSKPVAMLVRGTEKIARGDLTHTVPVKRKDEIGLLAASFNKMTEDLQKTTVSRDYVDNILRSMNDGLIVVSPGGLIRTVNTAICSLLGYEEQDLIDRKIEDIFSDTSVSFEEEIQENREKNNIEKTFLTKNGNEIPVLFSASIMYGNDDQIRGMVCVAKDIAERKQAEEQIKASLNEKEVLLKEIHHRVKNNLQVITSLLRLQSKNINDPDSIQILRDSQSRVRSMALVHEKLYQSDDLARIDYREYIQSLTGYIYRSYGNIANRIHLTVDIDDILIDIDKAIPCGLIVNELVSNAFKHAFPDGRTGTISIGFQSDDNSSYTMTISDNGIGLPKGFDWRHTNSLGLRLVNTLVNQLDGNIQLDPANDTVFTITFSK